MRRSSTGLAALLLLLVAGCLPACSALFGWGVDEPETDLTRPVFSYSETAGRAPQRGAQLEERRYSGRSKLPLSAALRRLTPLPFRLLSSACALCRHRDRQDGICAAVPASQRFHAGCSGRGVGCHRVQQSGPGRSQGAALRRRHAAHIIWDRRRPPKCRAKKKTGCCAGHHDPRPARRSGAGLCWRRCRGGRCVGPKAAMHQWRCHEWQWRAMLAAEMGCRASPSGGPSASLPLTCCSGVVGQPDLPGALPAPLCLQCTGAICPAGGLGAAGQRHHHGRPAG